MQADRQAGRQAGRQTGGRAGRLAGRHVMSLPFEWTGLHSGRLQLIIDQVGLVTMSNAVAYYVRGLLRP